MRRARWCALPVGALATAILVVNNLRERVTDLSEAQFERDVVSAKQILESIGGVEVRGYRAIPYDLPRGSAMGYMPELNVLCAIGDYSQQSDQPLMKHLVVEITSSASQEKPAATVTGRPAPLTSSRPAGSSRERSSGA